MCADHQHHGRSAVVMEPAQKATERRVISDEDQRLVGLRRRRNKRKCQNHAARHLHDERNHGGGSKNVPPFGVLRRDVLHRLEQHADPNPIIEPKPDRPENPLHNVVTMGTTTDFIFTSPFSTRTS